MAFYRLTTESQIIGAMIQGVSWALFENALSLTPSRTPVETAVEVSVRLVRLVAGAAQQRGLDVAGLLRSVGLEPAVLEDKDARVSVSTVVSLWAKAAARAGDEAFGLHVAESLTPGAFHLLDYAARASATLGEGLQHFSRYHHIVIDSTSWIDVIHEPDRCRVRLRSEGSSRQGVEFALAAWVVAARQATGSVITPIEVRFRHRAPHDASEHRRVFGCPVHFRCAANEVVAGRQVLDLPLSQADAGLRALLDEQLGRVVASLPQSQSLVDRARRLIAGELAGGNAGLAPVARRLGVSARTYRRRLKEAGATHRSLVEGARRELALRYLGEGTPPAEVAYLLGFSEASAFHRAFRRWAGTTPSEYRRSSASPTP